jgi:cytochrome c oxidase subunit 2
MKRVLPVLIALFVASSAYAQTSPDGIPLADPQHAGRPAGSGASTGSAGGGSAGGGSADGSAAAGSAAAGSAAAGSAAGSADGSAATGSAADGSGAGSGSGSAAPAGPAWYDVLANKPIEEEGNFWMPKAVNEAADESDMMFYAVLGLSAFFFAAIAIAVVYLVIKYRHRPGHKPQPSAAHNDVLEITWTVIPTIICVFLFWYGWHSYIRVVTPPNKAVEIDVLAWRWNWQFTHENGVTDSDLHVPAGVPVRLVMTSKDVLHSFYAPAMRVKQDVVPRRFTYAWFQATKPGTYRLTCAEYCGTSHAQMACQKIDEVTGHCDRRAVVVVHKDLEEYEKYLNDKILDQLKMPPVELGKMLYDKKGCSSCHTVDGSARVGPSWKQPDWGKEITLTTGSVTMDENYVRESILYPAKKSRPNFPNSMPPFEGQLKDVELNGLIAYIKSLKQ